MILIFEPAKESEEENSYLFYKEDEEDEIAENKNDE